MSNNDFVQNLLSYLSISWLLIKIYKPLRKDSIQPSMMNHYPLKSQKSLPDSNKLIKYSIERSLYIKSNKSTPSHLAPVSRVMHLNLLQSTQTYYVSS
jgi:hypothetical protein